MNIETPMYATYAALIIDNWDGEGDEYVVLAFKHDGNLVSFETQKPLLQHVGDRILKLWPLTDEADIIDQANNYTNSIISL